MPIPETPHHLHPIAGVALIFPTLAGRHGCPIRRTYLAYWVPPGMRRLQGHNVAHLKLAQRLLESFVLAVERIGHYRTKWDALTHGQFHQLGGYLQLGAEMGVLLATLEVVCRGVRLEVHWIVNPLICPQAAYADHSVFGLAYVSQPLPAYVSGLVAPFAVPMLVYDQNALFAGSTRRIGYHEFKSTLVDPLGVPPRFRKEPLQALRFLSLGSYNRLGVGKSGQSLVALGGQQQTLQVAPESVALSAGAKEIVEASSILFEWSRSRAYGVSSGHSEAPPPPLEHGSRPYSTNYRSTHGTRRFAPPEQMGANCGDPARRPERSSERGPGVAHRARRSRVVRALWAAYRRPEATQGQSSEGRIPQDGRCRRHSASGTPRGSSHAPSPQRACGHSPETYSKWSAARTAAGGLFLRL